MDYHNLLVFEPARVKEELLELRRVRRAQVSQAHRLLDVALVHGSRLLQGQCLNLRGELVWGILP